jgi:hypothetical protein
LLIKIDQIHKGVETNGQTSSTNHDGNRS